MGSERIGDAGGYGYRRYDQATRWVPCLDGNEFVAADLQIGLSADVAQNRLTGKPWLAEELVNDVLGRVAVRPLMSRIRWES